MLKVFEAMLDKESPLKKVTTEEIIQRHVYYIVSTRSHVALIKTCWYLIELTILPRPPPIYLGMGGY